MRIVSGKYKGRRIIAPKKLPVRPTTDQAKEALFNILWNNFDFSTISVLDLFSGIGSISLEFASRGVADITSVDGYFGCVKFLKKTAQELEAPILTVKSDAFDFLTHHSRNHDLIFADPPYHFEEDQFIKIADLVFEQQLLKENGLLIIEHSKHTNLSTHVNYVEERRYGSAVFSFFRKKT